MKYILKGTSSHPDKDVVKTHRDCYYSFNDDYIYDAPNEIPRFRLITNERPFTSSAQGLDYIFYTWDVLTEDEYILDLL